LTDRNANTVAAGQERSRPAPIPDKLYFKIREVSAIAGVAPYVLRYWESEFHQIRPKRTAAGQRLFRRQDVIQILEIKRLLYKNKFTIEGARRHLRKKGRSAGKAGQQNRVLKEIHSELVKLRMLVDSGLDRRPSRHDEDR
jgi:DNA-binding transcriptional MerR regulator